MENIKNDDVEYSNESKNDNSTINFQNSRANLFKIRTQGKIFIAIIFVMLFFVMLFLNMYAFIILLNNFTRIFEINIHINPIFYDKISSWYDYATTDNTYLATFINFLAIWLAYFMVLSTALLVMAIILLFKEYDIQQYMAFLWFPLRSVFRISATIYVLIQLLPLFVNAIIFVEDTTVKWDFLLKNWLPFYNILKTHFTILAIFIFVMINYVAYVYYSTYNLSLHFMYLSSNYDIILTKKIELVFFMYILMWVNIWFFVGSVLVPLVITGIPTLFGTDALKLTFFKYYLKWLPEYENLNSEWVYLITFFSILSIFFISFAQFKIFVPLYIYQNLYNKEDYMESVYIRFGFILFIGFMFSDFFIFFGVGEFINQLNCVFNNSKQKLVNLGFNGTENYFYYLKYIQSYTLIFFGLIAFSLAPFFILLIWELIFGWWGMSCFNYFMLSSWLSVIIAAVSSIVLFIASYILIYDSLYISRIGSTDINNNFNNNWWNSICKDAIIVALVPGLNILVLLFAPFVYNWEFIILLIILVLVVDLLMAFYINNIGWKFDKSIQISFFLSVTQFFMKPRIYMDELDYQKIAIKRRVFNESFLPLSWLYVSYNNNENYINEYPSDRFKIDMSINDFDEMCYNELYTELINNNSHSVNDYYSTKDYINELYSMYKPNGNAQDKNMLEENNIKDEIIINIKSTNVIENLEKDNSIDTENINIVNDDAQQTTESEDITATVINENNNKTKNELLNKIELFVNYSKENKRSVIKELTSGAFCFICDKKIILDNEDVFKYVGFAFGADSGIRRIFHIRCFEINSNFFEIIE
ncbi:hypothetical protein SLITO_v1c09590 [Spiroplasma litorale]|uniref:Transmembrane protein n=1 Tax=Spiroplasma litorale TaxID=216942 RepID=A0A0K1W2L3_9MOLU|nr:hypothetical protein [Spiroplasma litorale]AKX34570.1 hypothetical protein SLITO_v1c09590 [Spiroplasma litorale]